MQTSREKALSARSLICLLQAIRGRRTCIELRDDCIVEGKLISVDGFMNAELRDVTFKKPLKILSDKYTESTFDYFFVKGTRIRYVEIPEDLDPIEAIRGQLLTIQGDYENRVQASRREPRQQWPNKAERKNTEWKPPSRPQNESQAARRPL